MNLIIHIISIISLFLCIGCNTTIKQDPLPYTEESSFTLRDILAENIEYHYYPSTGPKMKIVKLIKIK